MVKLLLLALALVVGLLFALVGQLRARRRLEQQLADLSAPVVAEPGNAAVPGAGAESFELLAGGVAHDLNNVLSGVNGYAELMLLKLPPDSPFRKHADMIYQSGQRATEIIADLLTITRNPMTERSRIDLNLLVREYLDGREHAALMQRFDQLDLRCQLAEEHLPVNCSSGHIRKTLVFLIMAAAETSPAGTLDIFTEGISDQEVLLQICDSGPLFSDEQAGQIFDPFYARKKMGRSGNGLEMTAVWHTVRKHGGHIELDRQGSGNCFRVYLPLAMDRTEEPGSAS